MSALSVSGAFTKALDEAQNTFDVPLIGKLIMGVPIYQGHEELIASWRRASERLGFKSEVHPNQQAYRDHWLQFCAGVEEHILAQQAV